MKDESSTRLQEEYQSMLSGLRRANEEREDNVVLANPVLPEDVLKGSVPGNIRTADHFISFLKRLIEYIKTRLRCQHVVQETPAGFLKDIQQKVCIERKPLRFCAERLASLMRTLEVTDTIEFGGLIVVRSSLAHPPPSESDFLISPTSADHLLRHVGLNVHEGLHRDHRAVRRENADRREPRAALQLPRLVDRDQANFPKIPERRDHVGNAVADGHVPEDTRLPAGGDELVHNDAGQALSAPDGEYRRAVRASFRL